MTDLLKSIKANHRLLMILSAAAFLLLLLLKQRTVYDDALDELRTIVLLEESDMIYQMVSKYPRALESRPKFNDCWKLDSSLAFYLSKLTNRSFIGIETSCREHLANFFFLDFPKNDSLLNWVKWFDQNIPGTFVRCEESLMTWNPPLSSMNAETLHVVGKGFEIVRPLSKSGIDDLGRFDEFVVESFSLTTILSRNWTYDEVIEYKVRMPARRTFTLYAPTEWIDDIELEENMYHKFGDSLVIFGAVKSLGLNLGKLTISGAINEVQKLRKSGRNIDVSGISVDEPVATLITPLAIILMLVNLWFHSQKLKHTLKKQDKPDVEHFPWIPLYPGWLPIIYFLLTTILIPTAFATFLIYVGLVESDLSFFGTISCVFTFLVTFVIGSLVVFEISKVRRFLDI